MPSYRINEYAAELAAPEIEKINEDVMWEVGLQQTPQGPVVALFMGIKGSVMGEVCASQGLIPVAALIGMPELIGQLIRGVYESCQKLRSQQLQEAAPADAPSSGLLLPGR